MTFHSTRDVHVTIPKSALAAIFDECDQFDDHETGGRILGTYKQEGRHLRLVVRALIDSGPRARRSAVSFFQDGEYQEKVFRQIESQHPEIEHLGNWHTHHMNGLKHLSSGDLETYQRIVNHPNHNTPFFYALLVTNKQRSRDPLERYDIKHYLFRRNDAKAYEIPGRAVEVTEAPVIGSRITAEPHHSAHIVSARPARPDLLSDQDFVAEFYKNVRPFKSEKLGLYWRGPISLVNGGALEAVVIEDASKKANRFSLVLRESPEILSDTADELMRTEYPSVRSALLQAERLCNRALYVRKTDTQTKEKK